MVKDRVVCKGNQREVKKGMFHRSLSMQKLLCHCTIAWPAHFVINVDGVGRRHKVCIHRREYRCEPR